MVRHANFVHISVRNCDMYFHRERPIAIPICIRMHRETRDDFFRATGALPREADYLFKVGRGSHRPRWQSLASVIDDSVFPTSPSARAISRTLSAGVT